MFGILHRMIFLELWKVFFLALVALTGILLLGLIVAEATRNGLSLLQVIGVIPLLVFNTFPYTLPTTSLFATCIVYGRLAHDNEILAIKTAGIRLTHMIWPAVFLGLLASAVTFGLYWHIIPSTHRIMRLSFVKDLEEVMYTVLKRDGHMRHPRLGYSIFVKRVEGRKLIDAIFMRRDKNDTYDMIAKAREAELCVDIEKKQLVVHMKHCEISSNKGDGGFFMEKSWPIDLPSEESQTNFRPSQLPWLELEERREEVEQRLRDKDAEIARRIEQIDRGSAPPGAADELPHIKNERKMLRGDLNYVLTEMHLRPSLALGCLCFVLVGCPVGIWFSKSDYLSAFITCFLPIVFIYYPLLLCGINFSKLGNLSPLVAIWASNALLAVIAMFMFRSLLRH